MRYLYLIITLFIVSCTSVPKEYLSNDAICYYNAPIFSITKDEMTFDVKKYQKELEEGDLIVVDNESFKNVFYKWREDSKITNRQTNKLLNVERIKKYNENGKVLFSYLKYLNGSLYIGEETYYDEQGNITKVIDHEKGYNICWAEAIEIVKKIAKKDIEKYNVTGFNIRRVDLNEFPNEKPMWGISLDGNEEYELKDTKVYWVDGVTGKFLKTTKIIISYD